MDHNLIDQALAELLSIARGDRTAEQIQGWAHLICEAAGAPIEASTPLQREHVALHSTCGLLAADLGAVNHRTFLVLHSERKAYISPHIQLTDTETLYASGTTAEEALQRLRAVITQHGKAEAA